MVGEIVEILGVLFWLVVFFGRFFIEWGEEEIRKEARENGPDDGLSHCSFGECRSLAMKSTEFCWKHQDAKPHVSDGPAWWEEGGGAS